MMEIERNLFAIFPSPRSARQEFNFLNAICAHTMNLCATREFALRHTETTTYEARNAHDI